MLYTYYKKRGNSILFSYIENGHLKHSKIKTYKPTLYTKSDDQTSSRSIYGYSLKPIEFDSFKEADLFIDRYKNVDGFTVEGNRKYENQFVIESYEGSYPTEGYEQIRGLILDIEVSAPEFPKPIEAKYPIDLITLYDTGEDKFYVYGMYDYDKSIDDTEAKDLNVEYTKCDTESELLSHIVNIFGRHCYSYVSGWNTSGFDLPYIVNRVGQILGNAAVNRLSPYGVVYQREGLDKYKNPNLEVTIYGVEDLDYLLVYQKHTYEPRENYRLDTIANVELGRGKLSYEEAGTLFTLSKTNPQKYVSYNIIDVNIVKELDKKLALFNLTFAISYYCLSNYTESLKVVNIWEKLIARILYTKNMVPPTSQVKSGSDREFPGGFVAPVKTGFHEWEVSIDLNSLYPHIEMQVNISPETYIPRDQLPDELKELQDLLSVKSVSSYFDQVENLVHKEVDLSVLKKYDVSMAANGVFYKKDSKGIIPLINEELYNQRKVFKKDMKYHEQQLVYIKEEMKKRGL